MCNKLAVHQTIKYDSAVLPALLTVQLQINKTVIDKQNKHGIHKQQMSLHM